MMMAEESMEIESNDSLLNDHGKSILDSSESDSELPALPPYLCVTPKKENDDNMDRTPPISPYHSPYHGGPFPPSPSSQSPHMPYSVSPIISRNTILQNDALERRNDSRLLEKSRKRVSSTKEQLDRDDKILQFKSSGGILAFSKETEKVITKVREEMASQPNLEEAEQELQHVDIPTVPGIPFFTSPPKLVKGAVPFTNKDVETQQLLDKITTDIQNIYQLLLALNGKQCPVSVMYWLMDNSCLSDDIMIRHISRNALARIATMCSSLSCPLSIDSLRLVLAKLGSVESSDGASCLDGVRSVEESNLLTNSIKNFCKNVSVVLVNFGLSAFDSNSLQEMIFILFDLALDPLLCSDFVCSDVCSCLHETISCVGEKDWLPVSQEIILRCKNVTDHQNQQYIVTLMSSSIARISSLQRCLIRVFLDDQYSNESAISEQSDSAMAIQVVCQYIKAADISFGKLLSTMKMLAIFVQSPYMKWTGKSREDFINLLSNLAGSIKDNIPDLVLERGPVKDFVIALKFELQNSTPKGKIQKTMFDYVMQLDEDD